MTKNSRTDLDRYDKTRVTDYYWAYDHLFNSLPIEAKQLISSQKQSLTDARILARKMYEGGKMTPEQFDNFNMLLVMIFTLKVPENYRGTEAGTPKPQP